MQELVAQIRRHVSAHPSAADNLEGIRDSWLDTHAASVEAVRAALEKLTQEGYLNRSRLADGSIIYRRAA